MNYTFLQTCLQSVGRIRKSIIKKFGSYRKLTMLLMLLPVILPAQSFAANAADSSKKQVQTSVIVERPVEIKTNSADFGLIDKNIEITKTESNYQIQKAEAKKQTSVIKAMPVQKSPEPTDAEKRAWVKRAALAFGIDWKVLEAVWQVESGKQWSTASRSYAGAMGPCQFISGTWRKYAHDGDGNGTLNVFDARDCLYSSAKLLAANGASTGDNERALYAYNHASWYVRKVLSLARLIQD